MINISPAAENDLSGIALDIATHRPRIAQRWLETIQEIFEMLDRHPDVGEVRIGFSVPGTRVIHGSRELGNL